MGARPQPKHLVLILAREFAAELAVPVLVSDADGRLVYFNEAAEEIVGRSFPEAGELPASEWVSTFALRDEHGGPVELTDLPGGIALLEQRPAHGKLQMVGLDEVRRTIEVTAIPLLASRGEPIGVVSIFWPV
ncbi:MAG TPA: PAS domain-containing protein [Gaiellaceae bacterium]|nr:PAS domain-containing protein [Gaiellaceae bacterium]